MMRRLPDGKWLNLGMVTHVEVEQPCNSHPGALFRLANDRVVTFGGTRFQTKDEVQAWLDDWLGDVALDDGAPCATCNGTGKVERWYVHSNSTGGGKPCLDCGSGVAS